MHKDEYTQTKTKSKKKELRQEKEKKTNSEWNHLNFYTIRWRYCKYFCGNIYFTLNFG